MDGDCGAGLGFLLEGCELDIDERRFIHERRRVDTCRPGSSSSPSWSLGAYPFTAAPLLGRWCAVSSLVILLTMRLRERPSWLNRDDTGAREAGATGMGDLKEGAAAVVGAVVWRTAVDMDRCARSAAGTAFFLFGRVGSKGVSRPKDRPTAEAPTTVAVAQSCGTKMRQSWPSVQQDMGQRSRGKTGKKSPLFVGHSAATASRHIITKQGPAQGRRSRGWRKEKDTNT